MRIAMSCFAFPVLGRPTRRARFSSLSVDSGISEKSIRLSCISFAFLRARPPRGNDTNRFFAIFQSPVRKDQNDDAALSGDSQSFEPVLTVGVFQVLPLEGIRIAKNGGRFLERDAMLFKIPGGFLGIPGEHNLCIYNNYLVLVKRETILVVDAHELCGCLWKLVPFDWLTSILAGSIKIQTRAGSTVCANNVGLHPSTGMRIGPEAKRLTLRCAAVWLGAIFFVSLNAARAANPPADAGKFTGPGSCSSTSCHGSVKPRADNRIFQNEYSIWAVKDKHAKAYDALTGPTGERMGRILSLGKSE